MNDLNIDGMQELSFDEVEMVAGGSLMGAVFTGLVLGTILVGGGCLAHSVLTSMAAPRIVTYEF